MTLMFYQGHDAAAPACAREAGPDRTRECLGQAHQRLDLRRADLIVVTRAGMRLVHQPAKSGYIALFQRLDTLQHSLVFGDHVAASPPHVKRVRLRIDAAVQDVVRVDALRS